MPNHAVTGPVVPVLRMFDEAKAKAFYADFLGFTVDWEHRFEPSLPLYMQVSRAGTRLHLSEHHGDATPGSSVRIQTQGIDALHAELSAKGYTQFRACVELMPWGLREMRLTDPFGNSVIFFEEPQA